MTERLLSRRELIVQRNLERFQGNWIEVRPALSLFDMDLATRLVEAAIEQLRQEQISNRYRYKLDQILERVGYRVKDPVTRSAIIAWLKENAKRLQIRLVKGRRGCYRIVVYKELPEVWK